MLSSESHTHADFLHNAHTKSPSSLILSPIIIIIEPYTINFIHSTMCNSKPMGEEEEEWEREKKFIFCCCFSGHRVILCLRLCRVGMWMSVHYKLSMSAHRTAWERNISKRDLKREIKIHWANFGYLLKVQFELLNWDWVEEIIEWRIFN